MSNVESELKLRLTNSGKLSALLKFLEGLNRCRKTEENLQTIYYDTEDYRLLKAGLSYRLRTGEREICATVKTVGQNNGGLHQRSEFNIIMKEAIPDIAPFLSTVVGERLNTALAAGQLLPIFSTDFSRSIFNLTTPDSSSIELAVDCGKITAGEKTEPILEIELELKNGSYLSLINLGGRISRKFPLLIELESKLSRAMALAGIKSQFPQEAQTVSPIKSELKKEPALPWLIALLVHLLHQIINEHYAFLLNPASPEALYRLRNSLQRFAAILVFAKPLLEQEDLGKHQLILAELDAKTVELKNIDVLIKDWQNSLEVISSICEQKAQEIHPLTAIFAKKREKDAAKLYSFLSKGKATPFFLEIWDWLATQNHESNKSEQRLGRFVKEQCREWLEELLQITDNIDIKTASPQLIHQIRILNQNTCCALECFAPVLNKHTPALGNALKNMQDNLSLISHAQLSFSKLNDLINPANEQNLCYDEGIFIGTEAANLRYARKKFAGVLRKIKKISHKWLLKC